MSTNLKVLVVDDTALFRKILSDVIQTIDGVEVVGSASNGRIAILQIQQLQPDLVTLDIEMPEMDGLTALIEIRKNFPKVHVVMVSSRTTQGAKETLRALDEGALDFIEKPSGSDLEKTKQLLKGQINRMIQVVITKKLLARDPGAPPKSIPVSSLNSHVSDTEAILQRIQKNGSSRIKIVAIGVSTGGPASLPVILSALPNNLNVPLVMVQHMPPVFVTALVESLSRKTTFKIVEAKHDMPLEPGCLHIAPGGVQMKLIKKPGIFHPVISLVDDPPEHFCKPSVDYLFRSVAEFYGDGTLGVILTGMGKDGVDGLVKIKSQGGTVFAQDKESCVVFGMPMEAIKAGVVDQVISLTDMASAIMKRIR